MLTNRREVENEVGKDEEAERAHDLELTVEDLVARLEVEELDAGKGVRRSAGWLAGARLSVGG